ncbi:MAG: zinc ribbon domain-containing protein [Chloroflexi bacterium]|nr:MAG: zinc ribbon domain-containing protein [Chloroflexota bacterium]
MNQRIYHGNLQPLDLANALVGYFHRGNWRVQRVGDRNKLVVQIATTDRPLSGGQTALSVILQRVEDGVSVDIGEQAWLGVAAILGASAISLLANPWNLLHRLDDIAQDIDNLQLAEEVWKVLDDTAHNLGASQELSNRLRRITCEYCGTANAVGEGRCLACGAPLGYLQPRTCKKCGFVVLHSEANCPNCGDRL